MRFDEERQSKAIELLVKAEIVTQKQVDEANLLCREKHLRIEHMLIMMGAVSPGGWQSTVEAASMLQDRQINIIMAKHCLKIACRNMLPFDDVLRVESTRKSDDADT